jgi:thiol-disulfide isomerase/thioredoxin
MSITTGGFRVRWHVPPNDLARTVVVLFTISGCEACAEYKPRFWRIAQRYQHVVPIYMLDANDKNPEVQNLANRLGVMHVPVTFVLRRPTGMIRVEGAVPDSQIAWLLDVAAREAVFRYR